MSPSDTPRAEALLEHLDWTRRLARALVRDPHHADDLTQETWLSFLRSSPTPGHPVRPWLSRVMRNAVKERARRDRARADHECRAARSEAVTSDTELAERMELHRKLSEQVMALEPVYRRTILLRFFEGLTTTEIAQQDGVPHATVRTRVRRGIERMRDSMGRNKGGDWRLALLPLLPKAGSTAPAGVLIMGTKGMLVAAAGLTALIVGIAWWSGALGTPNAHSAVLEAPVDVTLVAGGSTNVLEPQGRGSVDQRIAADGLSSPATPLSGRVIDAVSELPIAGANVRLFGSRRVSMLEAIREFPELYEQTANGLLRTRTRADWPHLPTVSVLARFGRETVITYDRATTDAEPLAETVTDDEGRFTLVASAAGGMLVCEHPGYSPRTRAAHDPAQEWTLALWREREVRGVVVTPAGDPPGVPLELAFCAIQYPPPPIFTAEQPLVQIAPEDIEGVGVWTTECAADGTFRIRIATDSIRLSILTPGWNIQMPTATNLEEPMRLVAQPVLVVRFLDAGNRQPIESVRLLSREKVTGYVLWSGSFNTPDGLLELPLSELIVTPRNRGRIEMTVWSEDHSATRWLLDDKAKGSVREVLLERGPVASLKGVVRKNDRPAEGAVAALIGHSPAGWTESADHLVDAVRVGALGTFRLSAAPGRYILRIEHHEIRYFELIELPQRNPFNLDLDVTGRIEVTLTEELGGPRAEHPVTLAGADGYGVWQESDAEGQVVFANLAPQTYEVAAPFVWTKGAATYKDIFEEIRLERGQSHDLSFELPNLKGPQRVRVHSTLTNSYEGWRARVGGEAWQPLAPDGTVPHDISRIRGPIEVETAEGLRWSMRVSSGTRDGKVIELDLGSGSIEGTLLDENDQPLAGWRVYARPLERPYEETVVPSLRTNSAGHFKLRGLDAGRYRLDFRKGEQPRYDFDSGKLGFLPDAPAGVSPLLTLRLPGQPELFRFHGVLLTGEGQQPLADLIVVVECEAPVQGGVFLVCGGEASGHTRSDVDGRFETEIPRTPRRRVRVYKEWSKDGLVYEGTFENDGSKPVEILID